MEKSLIGLNMYSRSCRATEKTSHPTVQTPKGHTTHTIPRAYHPLFEVNSISTSTRLPPNIVHLHYIPMYIPFPQTTEWLVWLRSRLDRNVTIFSSLYRIKLLLIEYKKKLECRLQFLHFKIWIIGLHQIIELNTTLQGHTLRQLKPFPHTEANGRMTLHLIPHVDVNLPWCGCCSAYARPYIIQTLNMKVWSGKKILRFIGFDITKLLGWFWHHTHATNIISCSNPL